MCGVKAENKTFASVEICEICEICETFLTVIF